MSFSDSKLSLLVNGSKAGQGTADSHVAETLENGIDRDESEDDKEEEGGVAGGETVAG